MKFFVKVEVATASPEFSEIKEGKRVITGCTESREFADRNWGLGNYHAVYADDSHRVRWEAQKVGFID